MWVWSILHEFYTLYTQNDGSYQLHRAFFVAASSTLNSFVFAALTVNPRERTSILLMSDWIVLNYMDVSPPLRSIAMKIYHFLSSFPSSLPPSTPAIETGDEGKSRPNKRAKTKGKTGDFQELESHPEGTEGLVREKELVIEFPSENECINLLSSFESQGFFLLLLIVNHTYLTAFPQVIIFHQPFLPVSDAHFVLTLLPLNHCPSRHVTMAINLVIMPLFIVGVIVKEVKMFFTNSALHANLVAS